MVAKILLFGIILLVIIILCSLALVTAEEYKYLKSPSERKLARIFKSKAFWKWLWSVKSCKHAYGYFKTYEGLRCCRNCGTVVERK